MITKIFKISARSLYFLLELILVLLIFIAFAIRTSAFQTWLAQQTASYFSKEWNTVVEIEKVDIVFFDKVELQGIYLEDLRKDTLLYSQEILVNIDDWSLSESYVEIGDINLAFSRLNIKTYEGDSVMNHQFIADYFASEEEDDEEESKPFRLNVNTIGVEHIHFTFHDENQKPQENGMDFNHIDISYLSAVFSDFSQDDGIMKISIDKLKLLDRSGFKIKELTTNFEMNEQGIFLKPFILKINNTALYTDYLNFEYDSEDDLADFENKVNLRAAIKASQIDLNDIAYFVPDLWGIDQILQLKGDVSGPVNKLVLKDLDIETFSNTIIRGDLELPNFSDIEASNFKLNFTKIQTTATDLRKIQIPPYSDGNYLAIPENIDKLGLIDIQLLAEGEMSDVKVDLKGNTQTGQVSSQLHLQQDKKSDKYSYGGFVELNALDVGLLAQDSELGNMSGKIIFKGSGIEERDMRIDLGGSKVSSISYKNHNYTDINLDKGLLTSKDFKGHVVVKDDLLDFDFEGYLKFGGKNPGGKFSLAVNNAYLAQLNLIEDGDPEMNFRFKSNLDFSGLDPDVIYGKLVVENFNYYDSIRKYDFNDISVSRSENLDKFILTSGIADLNIDGAFNATHFYANLSHSLSQVIPNLFVKSEAEPPKVEEHFTFNLLIKDFTYISKIFIPELKIENNTQLKGKYYAESNLFNFDFQSGMITYDDYRFEKIHLKTDLANNHMDFDLGIENMVLNDSLSLPGFKWVSFVEDNEMRTNIKWDETRNMKDASFDFAGAVEKNSVFTLYFNPSYFHIKNDQWDLSRNSVIEFDSTSICISNFELKQNNQSITLNGVLSEKTDERLNFDIKDFNVNYISTLLGLDNEFEGILNGSGYLADPYNQFIFGSVNEIASFSIDKQLIGDLNFSQIYDSEEQKFNIGGNIIRDNKKTFDYEGVLDFNSDENQLDLKLLFDKTNIAFINAFVDEADYSNIRGVLDGKLNITGMFSAPKLHGDINFLSGNVKVGMLGVNLGFGGKITVRDGMIALNHLPVFDEEGNQGFLIATVFHDNFTNFNYDIFLDLEEKSKRFKIMDTKYREGDYYYGTAYIRGVVGVSGNESDVYIDVTAKTAKETKVVLPLSGPTQVSEQDFIVFVNNGQLEEELEDRYDLTGVHLNLKFDITKDAEFKLVFDESTGDVITAACQGPMNIVIDRYGDLKIYGNLEIDRGDYLFGLSNIVSKSFIIAPGGTISWIGDPYNANIDIATIYEVRTPMKALMAGLVGPEQMARYAAPELINCVLTLKGTLMEPEFEFDINAPRADDQARAGLQRVKKSEDELKKQFFSLLLLNKFIPPDGSGEGPAIGGAGSSAISEMISNQLNNLLSEMSDEYQIGIKYSNDQESHSTEFGVGLSTELLNEKLVVSGTVGVASTEATGKSASSVIGDIMVEYKLNDEGTFTISVFNESNEFDVTKSTLGRFTQGFGLRYRESFQTIGEFALVQTFLNVFRQKENKWSHPTEEGDKTRIEVPLPENEDEIIEKIIRGTI